MSLFFGFFLTQWAISLPNREERIPITNLSQDGIVGSYVTDAILSSADEAIILELALKGRSNKGLHSTESKKKIYPFHAQRHSNY